jgi:WD40 repeat protein
MFLTRLENDRECQELDALKGHTGWVRSVAFSSDGDRLASGSDDGTVRVWDAHAGQGFLILKAGTASRRNKLPRQFSGSVKGHIELVRTVAFSPDGTRLAGASKDINPRHLGEVKVWDAVTGAELLVLKGHASGVRSVAFSRDGARLATAGGKFGRPGEVKLWDAHTGQQLLSLKGHTDEVYSRPLAPTRPTWRPAALIRP